MSLDRAQKYLAYRDHQISRGRNPISYKQFCKKPIGKLV